MFKLATSESTGIKHFKTRGINMVKTIGRLVPICISVNYKALTNPKGQSYKSERTVIKHD